MKIIQQAKRLWVGMVSNPPPPYIILIERIPTVGLIEWIRGRDSFNRIPRSENDVFEDVFQTSRPTSKK